MTVIELSEYRDAVVALERLDIEFLQQRLAGKIRVTRPALGEGYILNPQQHVGVVELPSGTLLRSTPKVPIANLVKMLAEALDLPELLEERVDFERVEELLELTARHFVQQVRQIIDGGMHRAYVEQAENRSTLRGRIDFAEDLRANYALRHRVFCRFDEFTWDIPENQVIRQVLELLAAQPHFSRGLRNDLWSTQALMNDVAVGRFVSSDLAGFQYHRFNQRYEAVHRLCGLFLEGASLSEALGAFDGRAFLVDMNALFERFISRVLERRASAGVRVRAQVRTFLDRGRSIPIRPDLVIETGGRPVLVADCKYKAVILNEFRQSDVYQVLAYCTALECDQGMLISPASEVIGEAATVAIRGSDVVIRQVTVDLSVSPMAWDAELDRLTAVVVGLRVQTAVA